MADNAPHSPARRDRSLFNVTAGRPLLPAGLAEVISIAKRFGLTTYDACYLDPAHRGDKPLATLDRKLREAAKTLGISTIPSSSGVRS